MSGSQKSLSMPITRAPHCDKWSITRAKTTGDQGHVAIFGSIPLK